MIIYRIFLIVLFKLLIIGTSYCQSDYVYNASLLDISTNLPVEGANIIVNDTQTGATSDSNGRFDVSFNTFPTELKITHISYEDELIIVDQPILNSPIIYLIPKNNVIGEIVLSAENKVESLSKPKKYSLIDFQFSGDSIIRLELAGAKNYRLTVSDLDGNIEYELKLKDTKGIERLYKSCNNNHYLIKSKGAVPLQINSNSIELLNTVSIDTFNNFIDICKLKIGEKLFYQIETHNGLKKNIYVYNLESEKISLLKSIYNSNQINSYLRDLNLIVESQVVSNIRTNSRAENDRIRTLQEDGDFYLTVFYKPEFPIYLYRSDEKLILFNHIAGQLENYASDLENISNVDLDYVLNKKWKKHIVQDKITQKIYALFKHKKGTAVHLINLESGSTELQLVIESKVDDYSKLKIYDGYLYYLTTNHTVYNGKKELVKIKI